MAVALLALKGGPAMTATVNLYRFPRLLPAVLSTGGRG
jgi:hypothetical protein